MVIEKQHYLSIFLGLAPTNRIEPANIAFVAWLFLCTDSNCHLWPQVHIMLAVSTAPTCLICSFMLSPVINTELIVRTSRVNLHYGFMYFCGITRTKPYTIFKNSHFSNLPVIGHLGQFNNSGNNCSMSTITFLPPAQLQNQQEIIC